MKDANPQFFMTGFAAGREAGSARPASPYREGAHPGARRNRTPAPALFSNGPAGAGGIQRILRRWTFRSAEMKPPRAEKRRINYKLGSLYAVVTALLLSVQEPFSFLAAKRLSVTQFVLLTQVALLMSIPLLMVSAKSRKDLVLLLGNAANYSKFAALFLIGMAGLLLFKLGLSNAHPIIIAAIINLQPFFAAVVALVGARVPIPVSPPFFFGCLISAFLGAMAVAWSQVGEANRPELSQLAESAMHVTWLYAIPVPICSALGGTLVCKWFAKYDESAAMAANFFISALVLIPAAVVFLYWRSELDFGQVVPVVLMIGGTIIAASLGRVLYQISLSVTGNDNGFVTMFFLLIPVLTALISLALSRWIADLHFAVSWMFYVGLFVVSTSLLFFSLRSWEQPSRQ
jgi:drug/metabolite transporter (DMT)-like permease